VGVYTVTLVVSAGELQSAPALGFVVVTRVVVPKSFANDVLPIFRGAGTCTGCHGGAGGLGGLGGLDGCRSGHASLVGVPSIELRRMNRVEPGKPDTSWLMHKLDGTHENFDTQCEGGSCGSSMPLGQPRLSQGLRDTIRVWIAEGAVNDCP